MGNAYTQLYVQVILSVKGRRKFIQSSWEDELYKYITGILTTKEQKLLAINGMPDHIHIFFRMRPTCCLSDLMRELKKSTNSFINGKKFSPYKFEWQGGYGAFTYSQSAVKDVIRYIENQKEHHKRTTFREEYIKFLEVFEVEYKDEYLFEFYD